MYFLSVTDAQFKDFNCDHLKKSPENVEAFFLYDRVEGVYIG